MKPLLPLLLLLGGCEMFGALSATGRPVVEAYGAGPDLRVLDVESPLRQEKRIPILSTPEVFAVYVPSHAEGDLLFGEHWLFFKLKEAEWFTESLQDPDPPAAGEAPDDILKPLKSADWSTLVIPHRRDAESRR